MVDDQCEENWKRLLSERAGGSTTRSDMAQSSPAMAASRQPPGPRRVHVCSAMCYIGPNCYRMALKLLVSGSQSYPNVYSDPQR